MLIHGFIIAVHLGKSNGFTCHPTSSAGESGFLPGAPMRRGGLSV